MPSLEFIGGQIHKCLTTKEIPTSDRWPNSIGDQNPSRKQMQPIRCATGALYNKSVVSVNTLIRLEGFQAIYFATKLTSLFDTMIVLTTSLPSNLACTRSLASAASFIASSETSAGTTTRAINLPFN